ncbi:Histone transcription regulator 3, partial [Coemansia sp. RSA 2681]
KVAEMNPDLSHSLFLTPGLHPPPLTTLPVGALLSLNALPPPALPGRIEAKDIIVLNIRSDNDRVSLTELGTVLLKLFEESTSDVASAAFYSRVDVAISESTTANTDGIALADSTQNAVSYMEVDAGSCTGSVDGTSIAVEKPPNDIAAAGTISTERDHTSADEAGSSCATKGSKRRESLSGDEMPAKRRSTRFIERASSGVPGNVSSAGPSATAPGSSASRAVAIRSGHRRVPALLLDAIESPAYARARSSAIAWFEATGQASQSEFMATQSASTFVAAAAAQQTCLARGTSSKSNMPQGTLGCDDKAEWGLPGVGGKDKGATSKHSPSLDTHAECLSNGDANVESRYIESLTALIKSRSAPKVAGHLASASSAIADICITSSECQAVLMDNHGTVDLLLRFIGTAALQFYFAPAAFTECKDLKQRCLGAVQHTFDVLLDLVSTHISLSESIDSFRRAIRQASFVLLLLTDAIASQPQSRAMWISLHAAWARVMRSSMAAAKAPLSDQCVVQYVLSEAWTCYELDVLANDVSNAAVRIDECLALLDSLDLSGVASLAVSCVFSGEPLTPELARERQQHLAQFRRLSEAYRLAATDGPRAVDVLNSILAPFSAPHTDSLAFRQRVSALRLLAAFYRQQGAAPDESRVILYEISLYLSRLLSCCVGATMPARAVLVRSVECLRRLYEMAEDSSAVGQCLERAAADDGPKQLSTQLVAISLAIACHYAPDPVQERPSTSVEADFVGLAIWLAAELGFGLASQMSLSTSLPCLEAATDLGEAAPLDRYIELLSAIHDLLGERGICTAASGALLKHLLTVCRQVLDVDRDNLACWDVAASCLRCLFDIRLHSSNAQVHACEHLDMDPQCANSVYLLVEPEIIDAIRNRKGTGLRSDLKAILDKSANALGELDVDKHPRISMNLDTIDDYLDGTSMPSFVQADRALRAGTLELPGSRLPLRQPVCDSGFYAAYQTLPFVRAAAQHESILFRMRSGMTRAVEDYDKIIEDYRLNIALGAESSEAWYHLGRAYSDLADEMLLGTVSEIAECKYDIALLQRRSLSCAIQASQQLPPLLTLSAASKEKRTPPAASDVLAAGAAKANYNSPRLDNDDGDSSDGQDEDSDLALRLHVRVASSTGHLLYRMAARPLSLLALRVLPSNVLVSDDGTESGQQWDVGAWSSNCDRGAVRNLSVSLTKRYSVAPQSQRVYMLARLMFARASKLDAANWEWPYMLGKTNAKLGDSLTACALYLKACHLAVAAGSKSTAAGASAYSSQAHGPAVTGAAIPEVAMDALCKLLTVVTKLVLSEQMDAATARRFVSALPSPCSSNVDSGALDPTLSDLSLEDNTRHSSGAHAKLVRDPATTAVLCAIRSVVSQLCASDKRRRHHRSLFLLSWIDHHAEGLFWQNIIFEDVRHEASQQYRLLDPLLEFQVNKLLDAVRDATLPQPSPPADKPRQDPAVTQAVPLALPLAESFAPLPQAQRQDISTTADLAHLD